MKKIKNRFILSTYFVLIALTTFGQNTSTCPPPQQPYLINSTTTTAQIAWDSQNATDAYKVELYLASNNSLVHQNNYVATNQYLFTNLQPNTTYKALIYRWCGTGKDAKLSLPSEIIIKTVIEDIVIWVTDPSNPNTSYRRLKLPDLCLASCKLNEQPVSPLSNAYNLSLSEDDFMTIELRSTKLSRYDYYFRLNLGYDAVTDKLVICGQEANVPVETRLSVDKKTLYIRSMGRNIFSINYCCNIINMQQLKSVFFDIVTQESLSLNNCISPNPQYNRAASSDDSALVNQRNTPQKPTNQAQNEFKIKPNPISETAIMELILGEPSPVQITIFNVQGQVVYQQDCGQRPKGLSPIELKTEALLRGVYFVELKTKTNKMIKKVVKQ